MTEKQFEELRRDIKDILLIVKLMYEKMFAEELQQDEQ